MAKRRAFTITAGDQSENHHTMKKQGNGLAESGFSPAELSEAQKRFETELGCQQRQEDVLPSEPANLSLQPVVQPLASHAG